MDTCWSNLDQSCPHLIHIVWKWIVSGLKLDWANPHTVGGLDLDWKWIITGNEVFMWQALLWIEAGVCRKCPAVIWVYRKRIVVFTGADSAKTSWMWYSETRPCTSEWQVCYHMTLTGPCVQIIKTSVCSVTGCEIMWMNPDQVQTGLKWVLLIRKLLELK